MRRILLLIMLIVPFTARGQMVIAYYYGDSASYPAPQIEFNCLTHIAHAFIIPDSSGNFQYPSFFLYPGLINSAHENGKKIIVSIGGWGGSAGFSPMAADPLKRKNFISTLAAFIKQNGYDGADIDWEYPKAEDKNNFNSLVTEMRAVFDSAGIEILSAALPAMDWHNVFDASLINAKLTWAGIMTYDFYGPWEKTTGHNTALYSSSGQTLSVDASIKHWLGKGVNPQKLCMGMEFAGYKFNAAGLYKPHKGAGSISYIRARDLKGWNKSWDEVSKVPYLFQADSLQFITIDDTASIRHKSDFILENNIAGTIIWKLGLDYQNSYNELLNIIADKVLYSKPGIPLIDFPVNEENIFTPGILLKWNETKNPGSWLIQVSQSPEFDDSVINISTRNSYAEIPGLRFGKYFWRVRSETSMDESEWSETGCFYSCSDLKNNLFLCRYVNGKCLFGFMLNKNSFVSLKSYNLYSEPTDTIFEGIKEPGIHKVWIKYEEGTLNFQLIIDDRIFHIFIEH